LSYQSQRVNPGKEDEMHGPEVFLFPLVIIVVVFAFTGVVHWVDSQRKEREAFYRADTLKRFADAPGDGAKQAFDLLREQDRQRRIKAREGIKLGGLITVAVGAGLCIFLHAVAGGASGSPWLVGLIPGFVGVAMLIYVYFLAEPIH
jgi:Flp pilus assembly protein TadB